MSRGKKSAQRSTVRRKTTIGQRPPFVVMPAYDEAEYRLHMAVFELRIRADPVLSRIRFVQDDHAGPIRSVGGDNPYESKLEPHGANLALELDAVLSMDFAAYTKLLLDGADQAVASMARMFYRETGAIAEHIGHVYEGPVGDLAETLRRHYMTAELDFDENGNVVAPQFVVPPELADKFRAALDDVTRDPAVIARLSALRDKMLVERPKRVLLSPC